MSRANHSAKGRLTSATSRFVCNSISIIPASPWICKSTTFLKTQTNFERSEYDDSSARVARNFRQIVIFRVQATRTMIQSTNRFNLWPRNGEFYKSRISFCARKRNGFSQTILSKSTRWSQRHAIFSRILRRSCDQYKCVPAQLVYEKSAPEVRCEHAFGRPL